MNVVVVRSGRVYVLGTLLSLGDYLTQIADDTFISKCRFVFFVVLCSFEPFCFGSRFGVFLTMYKGGNRSRTMMRRMTGRRDNEVDEDGLRKARKT